MIQGDPGEGKTTLALRLAAACSTGQALPGMTITEPVNVIYQTAEDGLGDTIKPRLMEAGADEDRVLNIVEDTFSLTLLDERIEAAIVQTGAKLMILDPVQGYVGEKVDMKKTDFEEYKETGMIGAYYPERAIHRRSDGGVITTYRDCKYRITDDSFTKERAMVVNGKTYLVTSVFPLEPSATPTEKMLSYIDSELEKAAKSA